jgi:transposase
MEHSKNSTKKRTQKDYTLAFKLAVVESVEKGDMSYKQAQKIYGIQGRSTVLMWLRKHGSQNWSIPMKNLNKSPKASETPSQKIKRLEKELRDEKLRNLLYEEMIRIADEQYGTSLKKSFAPSN